MTNWPTKKLGELLILNDPGIWGPPINKSGEGVFILRSTNILEDGSLDFREIAERKVEGNKIKNLYLQNGDILLEKSGGGPEQPVGRVAYFMAPDNRKYIFANFIQRLRPKTDLINNRFLFFYLFFAYRTGLTQRFQSQTTGIRNLNLKLYFKIKIPVPPLPIQQKIVEKLDAIKKAQDLNDKQIALAEELFQSLLHRELDLKGKNWEVKRLGEYLVQFDRGISWSHKNERGSVAVLRIPNIEEGQINLNELKCIDVDGENGKLQKNDIVMVASNGNPDLVGRSALVTEREEGMRFASFLTRLKFDDTKLLPQYAHLFLLTLTFKRELRRKIATTSGIYNLRKEHIENIKIPISPLETQQKIVEKLSAVQEYKKKLIEQKQKLQELFESVLNKSFKGELVK
jgi:type I restriction enzyme S subunit